MTTGKLAIFIIFSFMLALSPAHAAGEDIGLDVGFDIAISETLADGPGSDVPMGNWKSLGTRSGTVGTISLISMSDSTLKYCPPVIWNSGTAIIDYIKIDLATLQQVSIRWFHNTIEFIDYYVTVPSSPYLSNGFKSIIDSTDLALINGEGPHTLKVEMWDSSGTTLLAYDERTYEIVPCSGVSLSLGPPNHQCLGMSSSVSIPSYFYQSGGPSMYVAYVSDEREFTTSRGLGNTGAFDLVWLFPPSVLDNIYNTAGFHYVRVDVELYNPSNAYISRTTIFNIQFCASISGAVTTSGGSPLQNVCVDAYSDKCGSSPYVTATTNSSGNYTISNLSPGTYYVKTRVACSTPQYYRNAWYNSGGGTSVCDQADGVTVASGQSKSGINITGLTSPTSEPYPAPVITSHALFSAHLSDGNIRTHIWARVSGPSPEDVASFTVTGPSGTFNLEVLQPPFRQFGNSYIAISSTVVSNGTYTFVVTDSLGRTATVTRNFTYDATVPQVDSNTMKVNGMGNYAYAGSATPTLKWSAVSGANTYQPFIYDYDGKAIWYTTVTEGTSVTVPAGYLQPDTPYYWWVRVNDASRDNRHYSNTLYFYTGTKGLPDLSHTIPLSFTAPHGQFKWFAARSINLAPWDISSFYVTGPDSTSYDYNSRSYRFQTPVYYASRNTGGSMPDGTYTFNLLDTDSNSVSKTQGFTYNPVPTVSEASRSPAPNAYAYTNVTFSWNPVSDSRTLYYKIRISDYNSQVIWYESPYSTQTSWTTPEELYLSLPYGSYKWLVLVSDGNSLDTANNIAFSSVRTITKANLSPSEYNYTLPGGTGVSTDYRMFTIPLYIDTVADVLKMMENTLGTYSPKGRWRAFIYTDRAYFEINDSSIASDLHSPVKAIWIITRDQTVVPFTGDVPPKATYAYNMRNNSWITFGLPWSDTAIELGKIAVSDGTNTYFITSTNNPLTGHVVWEYTGTGGYVQLGAGATLTPGTGYFIQVKAQYDVRLLIPPDNNGGHFSVQSHGGSGEKNLQQSRDEELPPPPPGAQPSPDIKTNRQGGAVTVPYGAPVSVTVSLDPGNWAGRNADWWIAAHTPFAPPRDWYTYVYPSGWQPGIHLCAQTPLFQTNAPFEVLNIPLPVGDYTFYFAVDGNADGGVDATWFDAVEVKVE